MTGQGRIQVGMSLRQSVLHRSQEVLIQILALRQKPETLEDGAIAPPIRILDQYCRIAIGSFQIMCKAVLDMLNAAAHRRITEHVDKRAMNVRYGNTRVSAPQKRGSEDPLLTNMPERKYGGLLSDGFSAHSSCRKDHGVAKHLLRQIPIFCGRPSTDVSGVEQGRNQYPGIREDLLGLQERNRHRHVGSGPDAPEPTLLRPACQQLCRSVSFHPQNMRDIADAQNIPGGLKDRCQSCSSTGQRARAHH